MKSVSLNGSLSQYESSFVVCLRNGLDQSALSQQNLTLLCSTVSIKHLINSEFYVLEETGEIKKDGSDWEGEGFDFKQNKR